MKKQTRKLTLKKSTVQKLNSNEQLLNLAGIAAKAADSIRRTACQNGTWYGCCPRV